MKYWQYAVLAGFALCIGVAGLASADAPAKSGIPTFLIEIEVIQEPVCETKQHVERRSTYTPGFGVSLSGLLVSHCNCSSYTYLPGVHQSVPGHAGSHTRITYEEVCE